MCATLTKGLNELKSLLWWEEEEEEIFLTLIGSHWQGVGNSEKSLLIREKSEKIPKNVNKSLKIPQKIPKNTEQSQKISKNS